MLRRRSPSSLSATLLPIALAALIGGPAACGSETGTTVDPPVGVDGGAKDGAVPATVSGVVYAFGAEIPAAVKERIRLHLKAASPAAVELDPKDEPALAAGALHLLFGHGAVADRIAPASALPAGNDDERFVVLEETSGGGRRLAAVGDARTPRASVYASYTLLENLGFGFLHPLAPTVPPALTPPANSLKISEAPRWKTRAIHLHTQHPLELTELLQGWGVTGPEDASGFEAMLPEWDRYLEWLLANRQTEVEWFLLYADDWKTFADGPVRQARLKRLVDRAHEFGIKVGLDVPIVFGQQHAFRLLRNQNANNEAAELAEIDARIDWVLSCGFDFLGTESGTSEFTAPAPQRMLDWMNEVTKHSEERWKKPVFIKAHASTGQTAKGFPDPATGKDINFNFLPHHADPRLGVLPHTVQHYGLHDPAPTYNNTDFGYLHDFLRQEVGRRPVLWYPETAYWVSFDVDVPLFLPIYAERRLSDLRLIADDEANNRMSKPGAKMDGQLIFSSGWEWGYWMNDVVAARAAWNPGAPTLSADEAFRGALQPVTQVFGAAKSDVENWIVDVSKAEYDLLILGKVAGKSPSTVVQRNGQAYLQGWETWDDMSKVVTALPPTQPDKLGLVDMRNPLHSGPGYTKEVDPLLAEMEARFATLAVRGDALRSKVPAYTKDLLDDLADAAKMTALRAAQVHGLYTYVDGYFDSGAQQSRLVALANARKALDDAALVVKEREKHYRVPVARIAGWRPNPTAYSYGYLWTVHSQFYFWRDEGKAVDAPAFPCYLNLINPVNVAFGEGFGTDAARVIGGLSAGDQRGCLAEPKSEPSYPQDNLRSRP